MNKRLQFLFGFVRRVSASERLQYPISLPWMNFGWSKLGDASSSGMFYVRGSWSMRWKVEIPRRPLQGQQKSHQFWISVCDGRSYSPMFWRTGRSFFEQLWNDSGIDFIENRTRRTEGNRWVSRRSISRVKENILPAFLRPYIVTL